MSKISTGSVAQGLAAAAAVAATLLLAGCGGGDAANRASFISFLKTRILDKPGMHVPQLTTAERSSFGRYAKDYGVMTDFNETMNKSVSPKLTAAVTAGSITSLEDVVTRRAQLQAARTGVDAMGAALGGDLAQADAAHAKLKQPADLKPVYDQAYDRLVTQPAVTFKGIVPVMDKVLDQAVDLGGYIDAHRAQVQLSGSTVRASDPTVRAEINKRLLALQSSQQAVLSAQRAMQSVVYGGS